MACMIALRRGKDICQKMSVASIGSHSEFGDSPDCLSVVFVCLMSNTYENATFVVTAMLD